MPSLKRLIPDSDREMVNQAIREAESATSAEIVPVIAATAGRYDRGEDIVGLWFALIAIVLVTTLSPLLEPHAGDWGDPSRLWPALTLCGVAIVAFIAGSYAAGRIDWLRSLCTSHAEKRDEVQRHARAIFFDRRVHHTAGGSGVLLYVAMFERMAVVLADAQVVQKLGQEKIDALCAEFTGRLSQAGPVSALSETARLVGKALAEVLPGASEDVNELPDALVLIE